MADPVKLLINDAIQARSANLHDTWNCALTWAATAETIIEIIREAGALMHPDHFSALIDAAALARHQSLEEPAESEVLP